MCGSDPTPPAPVAPKTPVASDPNLPAQQALLGTGQSTDNNSPARKSLNIDLASGGQGGTGLSIPT